MLHISKGQLLKNAAKSGNLQAVAELALELYQLAKSGNFLGVNEMLLVNEDIEIRRDVYKIPSIEDVKYHSHITVIQDNQQGLMVQLIPSGLSEPSIDSQFQNDALRLLAITEPLLDLKKRYSNEPASTGIDLKMLQRTIISVSQVAARYCLFH